MRANRIDTNQREIVNGLRSAGATVQPLNVVKHGCPDLLCGFRGANVILEVKTESGELTPDEHDWIDGWRGQVAIVRNVDEALRVIGAIT